MKLFQILLCYLSLFLLSCGSEQDKVKFSNDWIPMNRVAKTLDNITYTFPADVSIVIRDSAIRMNEKAIKENLELIEENEFKDTIKFEFFHTRSDMKLTCGYGTKGLAIPS